MRVCLDMIWGLRCRRVVGFGVRLDVGLARSLSSREASTLGHFFSLPIHDDMPATVLAALRWHMGIDDEAPDDPAPDDYPYSSLLPGQSRLPGDDIVSLRRTVRECTSSGTQYEWELFVRIYWVDDLTLHLDARLELIAPHVARRGCGGYVRDEYDIEVTTFNFHDDT